MIKPLSKIRVIKGEGKISADSEGILASFSPGDSTFGYAVIIITRVGKKGKPRIANHVLRIPYYTEKEIKEMFPLAKKQQEIAMKCLQNVNTASIESLDLEKRILILTNLDFLAYITAKSINLGALLNTWRIVVQADPGRDCLGNAYSEDETDVRNCASIIFSQCPTYIADLVLTCSNQDHLEHKQHGFRFAILENIVSKPDMRDCIMKELCRCEAKYAKIIDKNNYSTIGAFAAKTNQFVARVKKESNIADGIINTPKPVLKNANIWPAQNIDGLAPILDTTTPVQRAGMLDQDLVRVNVPNDKKYTVWMRSELPEDSSYRYLDITIILDPSVPIPDRFTFSYIANFLRGCNVNPDELEQTRINHQTVCYFPGIIRIPVHYGSSGASYESIRIADESPRNEVPVISDRLDYRAEIVASNRFNLANESPRVSDTVPAIRSNILVDFWNDAPEEPSRPHYSNPRLADVEHYISNIDEREDDSEDEEPLDLASIGLAEQISAEQISSDQFLEDSHQIFPGDSQVAADETGLVEGGPQKLPHIPENSEFITSNHNIYGGLGIGSVLLPGPFTYSDVSIKKISLSDGSARAITKDLVEMIEYFTGRYVDPSTVKGEPSLDERFRIHFVPGLIRLVERGIV